MKPLWMLNVPYLTLEKERSQNINWRKKNGAMLESESPVPSPEYFLLFFSCPVLFRTSQSHCKISLIMLHPLPDFLCLTGSSTAPSCQEPSGLGGWQAETTVCRMTLTGRSYKGHQVWPKVCEVWRNKTIEAESVFLLSLSQLHLLAH